MAEGSARAYGAVPHWQPGRPQIRLRRVLLQWVTSAVALYIAALIVPGVHIEGFFGAILAAALIAVLNALLPPLIAALRLPYMLAVGFLLVLLLDALMVVWAAALSDNTFEVNGFFWALLVALVAAAVTVVLEVLFGTNDEDVYSLRVTQRIARRSRRRTVTDVPGVIYLEIDGLARPVLQRAMRDGHAPEMARWVASGSHVLSEWETDLSSQTGASQAGLLLGSNDDIPAFRWVEKDTGRIMTCSAPADCALIEERHSSGHGLLADGGASRSNLLSGDAAEVILTVSRMEAEKKANPGYRAYLADGYNVTRTFVLFFYEVILELVAAARQKRRDVRPRGHRSLSYAFLRAGLAVFVRDFTVYSILSDMMMGVPAVYACFAGYDEVAHHSGLERHDALEVLRKLDQQFGRIARARQYAARPYEIVVLSDHGQTQGATFKQRNGYGLDELVERSLRGSGGRAAGLVEDLGAGDENDTAVSKAVREATGRKQKDVDKHHVGDRKVVVMGSGNLGLIYLMDEPRRLTMEEIDEQHPDLLPALRAHPHVGWLLLRSEKHGAVALGADGVNYLNEGRVEGDDPLAGFSPTAATHLLRTDGFSYVADIMVNSFYDEQLDEGCAFEELISFHGGMGGPQTRPFILHPVELEAPDEPIIGAESAYRVLAGWRGRLQGGAAPATVATPGPDEPVEASEAPPGVRPRRLNTAIAALFMIGSAGFALGATSFYASAVGPSADAVTFFVSSIFFTSASFLQLLQSQSPLLAASGTARDGERQHLRFLAWLPHDKGWLAAATQFPGTLFFNGTTFWAMTVAIDNSQYDKVVWRPDFFGSVLFLVSSAFAILALGRLFTWRPREAGWWVAWLNMIGSVAFMASAIGAFVIPRTETAVDLTIADRGTFAGAVCFFLGALLAIPAWRQAGEAAAQTGGGEAAARTSGGAAA